MTVIDWLLDSGPNSDLAREFRATIDYLTTSLAPSPPVAPPTGRHPTAVRRP